MESIIILIRKSCDQIQVLVDVSKAVHLRNTSLQFVKIHMSVDRMNGVRICGLYTDLELDKSGRILLISCISSVPGEGLQNSK